MRTVPIPTGMLKRTANPLSPTRCKSRLLRANHWMQRWTLSSQHGPFWSNDIKEMFSINSHGLSKAPAQMGANAFRPRISTCSITAMLQAWHRRFAN